MKIRFDKSEYVRSHGRDPKGTGMWMFDIAAGDGDGRYLDIPTQTATGTLTQAKKKIREMLKDEASMCGGLKEATVFILP